MTEPFSNWVRTQTHRWDSVGRLAREAFHNPNWPTGADLEGCLEYLKKSWQGDPRAQGHLVNALIDAWGDYRVVVRCASPGIQCSNCSRPIYPTDEKPIRLEGEDDGLCLECSDDEPSIFVVGRPIALEPDGTVCGGCLEPAEVGMLSNNDVEVWREGTDGWVSQPADCERCGRKIDVVINGKEDDDDGEQKAPGSQRQPRVPG
jgi:hypothetical protein